MRIFHKNKEVMAIAVVLTTQFGHCLEIYRKALIAAGATEAKLAEVTFVALRAGAAHNENTVLYLELSM